MLLRCIEYVNMSLTLYYRDKWEEPVVDLESQQRRVVEAQISYSLIVWQSRTWVLWALIAVLMLGWIHEFDRERRSIRAEIELLEHQGPPTECYFFTANNSPEHPIPFSMSIAYVLALNNPGDTCRVYYTRIQQWQWPSPWTVTVKFVMTPTQHVIHTITQAPWLIQILLALILTITVIVYLTAKLNPIQIHRD